MNDYTKPLVVAGVVQGVLLANRDFLPFGDALELAAVTTALSYAGRTFAGLVTPDKFPAAAVTLGLVAILPRDRKPRVLYLIPAMQLLVDVILEMKDNTAVLF